MGMTGISKSQVSRLCGQIDDPVEAFLARSIEGYWPSLWIDATYLKVRQNGRIVRVAVIVAVGVNSDGRRMVLGMDIGPSEAETFWTAFLRKLSRPGLRVLSRRPRGHQGYRSNGVQCQLAALPHFMRNPLAHTGKSGQRLVAAFIAAAFAQNDVEAARAQWRKLADQLRPELPKLADFLDEAAIDMLPYRTFPTQHRRKLHSTNRSRASTARSSGGRRWSASSPTSMPSSASSERSCWNRTMIGRPGARYMTLVTIAPLSDDPAVRL